MKKQEPDFEKIQQDYSVMPEQFDSLLLGTVSAENKPLASYAPYLKQGNDYFVFISELAHHTRNLQANPACSVLFIQNEQDAQHLFARQRLTLDCEAVEIDRHTERFEQVMDGFVEKFGKFMTMMREMQDFHLFRLTPLNGNYVAGFAQAYEISGSDLGEVKHRNEQGHRRGDGKTANAEEMQSQAS